MTTRFILEDVAIVENDFSADSRNKEGIRVVTYDVAALHQAPARHRPHRADRGGEGQQGRRGSVDRDPDLGVRYVTRRSAQELCAAIASAD
jgi:hypothetical protein